LRTIFDGLSQTIPDYESNSLNAVITTYIKWHTLSQKWAQYTHSVSKTVHFLIGAISVICPPRELQWLDVSHCACTFVIRRIR